MKVDEISLEVLSGNKTASSFWRSVGFEPADRFLFRQKLGEGVQTKKLAAR
jgi:ribosomal protein S18 acetylase RimI-like enzyme